MEDSSAGKRSEGEGQLASRKGLKYGEVEDGLAEDQVGWLSTGATIVEEVRTSECWCVCGKQERLLMR